ncbi:MAG: iron ABC transporter permease [Acidobacteria bacterium]|nr:iron ABC transporter permease [Acidobacteriota bacterium]
METDLRMRARRVFLVSFALLAVVTVAAPFLGGTGMDMTRLARREAPDWQILVSLRVPRTLLALLAGASLSTAGALFQAILRDALATPSNLGVSAAAALGAVMAIALLPGEETGLPWAWISSLAGTAAVIALVAVMRSSPRFSPASLLLTGIAINGICASVILLLHSLAGIARGFQITYWLMGGLDAVTYPVLGALAMVVVPVWIWILRMARVLNVMSYGDTWAAGRGVDSTKITWLGFAAGAVLAGVTTAVTGPIAFVGLIVPHLLRRVTGPDYRVLMPACLFCGGAFLIICDTVARTVLAPVEIPVGVMTALLGGPFFVWLLWSR